MAEITASMVKELREKTAAGMMECKKALVETEGDMEAAIKALRESGAAKAAKREGRTAAEGLVQVAISDDQKAAGIVEFNCETDFVARNDEFQAVVKALAAAALREKTQDAETLLQKTLPEYEQKAQDVVNELLAKIGEKIQVSRAAYVEADYVAGYVHPPGKIGTVVAVELNGADKGKLSETLKGIAMHIAAADPSPRFLREDEVDQSTLDAEAEIFANIARNEGKPEAIIPRIVEGKVKSFYKDNCLLLQEHVMVPKSTVQQVLAEAGKEAGGKPEIVKFHRFKVGQTAAQPAAVEG